MLVQAQKLIRALLAFAETLADLPAERILSMKVTYYDDITPPTYEPKYFRSAPINTLCFSSETNPLRIKIGSVTAPYHKLDLKFVGIDADACKCFVL